MPIQRQFIDWNQPVLPATADYTINRYASGRELDLRSVVLVFTGRRASRRMLELLLEKAAKKWPAFIPPIMTTFQQFPEMLYRQRNQLADDLTQLLVWKKALSSISARELKAALPNIPKDDAVPSWLSLCESLRTQHNELAEDGMEFDEVFTALLKAGNREEGERWKALRRIQSEYLVQMDNLELWDRQASRLIAVQNKECVADFDILLIGTVDISKVVRQMLDQVADKVTAIVHAPESEADSFDEHGCLIPDAWTERRLDISVENSRIANNPDEQAELVVHEIASHDGAIRPDDVTIGIADDTLVPTVLQKLADAGVSGRWPVDMQLKNTRPWRLLNAVVEHLGSARDGEPPDFRTFCALVRHPDVSLWVDNSVAAALKSKRIGEIDWLTELDNYTARHLQTSPGVLLGSSSSREAVGAVISAVEQMLAHICTEKVAPETSASSARKASKSRQLTFDDQAALTSQTVRSQLESQMPLGLWLNGALKMLAAVYRDHELHVTESRDRGITACFKELASAADQLSKVPDTVMPRCSASQAIQLMLRQIGDEPVPPETGDDAVDLLGWLELPMDDAPQLILTGFNEGYVPESITSDVFLPNSFRSQLGLRDNKRRYARDAYAVTALMHSREKVVFLSTRRDSKGNPMMPSRLWFAADVESLPDRVKRFYDEEHQPASLIAVDAAEIEPEVNDGGLKISGFRIPEPTLVPPAPDEISVTSFKEYLHCPYRYFLKRELRLKSVADETLELDAAAFGSLMHDVLKAFGTSDFVHASHPEPIETFLLSSLASIANKRFGRKRSATVAVQLQMLQNRLSAFALWQAQTAAEGWRVAYTEEDLKYPEFKDAKGRSVILAGRVDRIDQHNKTKRWRVLDYKTSETAEKPDSTHRKKNEWVDLQLPLYRLLVRSLGIDDDVELGYVHLPGDLSSIGASIAKWDRADFESAEETARSVAANIVDLKIDRIAPGQEHRFTEFARVCQDTVIDRSIPWLNGWPGR
ncbi:MAG: PD-(D/E)XK nuclease family protein [Fuerstiella sp.]